MGNARVWSDDDLRTAVASQHTWRGVAQELGLATGSTNSVQRHARRLGLDTSHFRDPRRTWSDADLQRAVAVSETWTGMMRELGLSETGAMRLRVIARARYLGLEVSPRLESKQQTAAAGVGVGVPDRRQIVSAAERIAIAWFALRGIPVSAPLVPEAYDLLATLPDGVSRVQVKSTTYRGKAGTWQVVVGRRPYTPDKSAHRLPYDPDELDYFFIIDGDAALYLIPSRVLAGRTRVNIGQYRTYRVGDASSLLADGS